MIKQQILKWDFVHGYLISTGNTCFYDFPFEKVDQKMIAFLAFEEQNGVFEAFRFRLKLELWQLSPPLL